MRAPSSYPSPLAGAVRRRPPCPFLAPRPPRRRPLGATQRPLRVALLMAWPDERAPHERFVAPLGLLAVPFPRRRRRGGYTGRAAASQERSGSPRPALARRLRRAMPGFADENWRRGRRRAAAGGSRVERPRTAANGKAPGRPGRRATGPRSFLTTLWHTGLGRPREHRVGPGAAGERRHPEDVLGDPPDHAPVNDFAKNRTR